MIKKTIDIIINLIPLKLFDIFFGHKIIGLEYHLSSNEKLSHITHLFKYKSNKLLGKCSSGVEQRIAVPQVPGLNPGTSS